MTHHQPATPVYLKCDADQPAPDDACYYLLTGDGLFLGRNTTLHRSLVPAPRHPGFLAGQAPRLELRFPRVPASLLARIFGFFRAAALRYGAEAVVLLAWDEAAGRLHPIVPQQLATVGRGWDRRTYPLRVHYGHGPLTQVALRVVGDVHSHVFEPAYASATDVTDEVHSPGLHVVAGRLDRDPPDLHVEYVVDGMRFAVEPNAVLDLEHYTGPSDDFSPWWMQRLRVETAAGVEVSP